MAGVLSHKVAVITGAGGGIGAATANTFVREGAKVVLASRTEKEISQIANKLGRDKALAVVCDVSNEDSVKNLFKKASDAFGAIDILINNAGVFKAAPVESTLLKDWNDVFAVNSTGTFLCAREAIKYMKAGGSIVNISSVAGVRNIEKFSGFGAYAAAKAAVIGLTEVLAVEMRSRKIRVNCVAPGAVMTKMLKEALPQAQTDAMPEDIAGVILGLCDESRSRQVTGAVIEVFTQLQS